MTRAVLVETNGQTALGPFRRICYWDVKYSGFVLFSCKQVETDKAAHVAPLHPLSMSAFRESMYCRRLVIYTGDSHTDCHLIYCKII